MDDKNEKAKYYVIFPLEFVIRDVIMRRRSTNARRHSNSLYSAGKRFINKI